MVQVSSFAESFTVSTARPLSHLYLALRGARFRVRYTVTFARRARFSSLALSFPAPSPGAQRHSAGD